MLLLRNHHLRQCILCFVFGKNWRDFTDGNKDIPMLIFTMCTYSLFFIYILFCLASNYSPSFLCLPISPLCTKLKEKAPQKHFICFYERIARHKTHANLENIFVYSCIFSALLDSCRQLVKKIIESELLCFQESLLQEQAKWYSVEHYLLLHAANLGSIPGIHMVF